MTRFFMLLPKVIVFVLKILSALIFGCTFTPAVLVSLEESAWANTSLENVYEISPGKANILATDRSSKLLEILFLFINDK